MKNLSKCLMKNSIGIIIMLANKNYCFKIRFISESYFKILGVVDFKF